MNVMLLGRGIRFGVDDGSDNPAYVAAMRSQAAAMREAEKLRAKETGKVAETLIAKAKSGEAITDADARRIGMQNAQTFFTWLDNQGIKPDEEKTGIGIVLPIGIAVAAYFALKH